MTIIKRGVGGGGGDNSWKEYLLLIFDNILFAFIASDLVFSGIS